MRRSRLEPDVISYSAVISVCEKGQHWARAKGLLHEMCGFAVSLELISCNAAIAACEKGQQWEHSLSLLWDMQRVKTVPESVSYKAAISASGERAFELCMEMHRKRLELDELSVAAALSAAESSRPVEPELRVLER